MIALQLDNIAGLIPIGIAVFLFVTQSVADKAPDGIPKDKVISSRNGRFLGLLGLLSGASPLKRKRPRCANSQIIIINIYVGNNDNNVKPLERNFLPQYIRGGNGAYPNQIQYVQVSQMTKHKKKKEPSEVEETDNGGEDGDYDDGEARNFLPFTPRSTDSKSRKTKVKRIQRQAPIEPVTETTTDVLDAPATTTEISAPTTSMADTTTEIVTPQIAADEPVVPPIHLPQSGYNTILQPLFGLPMENSSQLFVADNATDNSFAPLTNDYGTSHHSQSNERIDITTSFPALEYREYEFIPSVPDIVKNTYDNSYFVPIIIPSFTGYERPLPQSQPNQYVSSSGINSLPSHKFDHQHFYKYIHNNQLH